MIRKKKYGISIDTRDDTMNRGKVKGGERAETSCVAEKGGEFIILKKVTK